MYFRKRCKVDAKKGGGAGKGGTRAGKGQQDEYQAQSALQLILVITHSKEGGFPTSHAMELTRIEKYPAALGPGNSNMVCQTRPQITPKQPSDSLRYPTRAASGSADQRPFDSACMDSASKSLERSRETLEKESGNLPNTKRKDQQPAASRVDVDEVAI